MGSLCPDWQDWNPKDSVQNASEAMGLADDWLNVRQLIKPEEMVNPNIDEMSMMTYLSQYPNAKLKTGAPLRPRTNPNSTLDYRIGRSEKKLILTWKLLTFLASGRLLHFAKLMQCIYQMVASDAGRGVPEVIILDPAGVKTTVPVKLRQISPDVWRCEYVSPALGLHSVNVFFAGQPIPDSPFGVRVSAVSDAKKVRASGRGLQPKGVRVKDAADFKIYTEGAGEGSPEVRIIGPGGVNEPVKMKKVDGTTYEVVYHPRKEGRYMVMVTFAGQEVPRSPFEVNVGPYKETMIRAYGPGLQGGVVGYPALFTVETNGETGALGFSIEGPSKAEIECNDNGDGSADVRYYPTVPGEYAVHILCNDEDIPKSPYIAQVLPKTDYHPEKVECFGPGLERDGVTKGKPAVFTVDTRRAGSAPLDIQVTDGSGNPVEVKPSDNRDGTYTCTYVPRAGSKHTIQINYGGVSTNNSPYRVYVTEPTNAANVHVFGPGVEKGVKSNSPTHFNIDCRQAGPVQLTDNEDGTYTVDYCPPQPGNYTVIVRYAGTDVPQSPIRVPVQPSVDVSKIKVDGLEPTAPINSLQQFRVITQGAGKADFAVAITSPSGNRVKAHVIPTHEGFLVNFTPTELGEYLLSISFGGEAVSGTPYRFMCMPGSDASKVRAHGPGLERGVVGKPAEFIIDTRGAGQGGLGVTVEGPCEAAINCRDNGDGTCSVAYLPTEIGDYSINITFNDQHIPGSPFQAVIVPEADLKKIKVSGNGIQPHGVYVDSPTDFVVDSRAINKKSDGKVTCTITNPSGSKLENLITPMADGTFKISYTPFEEGRHTIDIVYNGIPIPGSPFFVHVRRGCDPKRCRAYGPGLEKGFVDKPNVFTVETRGAGTGGLGLAIEGPSEAKITCKDNRNGSCSVEYIPTEAGEYDVSIRFADQHIPGSPFKVPVDKLVDASVVKAYGPGLEASKCRADVPMTFKIDASKSGKAPLSVNIQPDKGTLAEKPEIRDNGDGTYDVTYYPPPAGTNLKTHIKWDGTDIPNSPFQMKVLPTAEPDKVKVTGPGVANKSIPASLPVDFTIDATEAGYGDLEVQVLGPDRYPRNVKVVENGDGTFKATYVPDDCGLYTIRVTYAGQVVDKKLGAQAHAVGEAEKCSITEGIQNSLTIGEEYCITVNTKNAGRGAVTCRIRSTSDAGSDLDIDIEDNGDDTFSIYYTVKDAGEYTLNVKFGGQPVPNGFYTFTTLFFKSMLINSYFYNCEKNSTIKILVRKWKISGMYISAFRENTMILYSFVLHHVFIFFSYIIIQSPLFKYESVFIGKNTNMNKT
ncbi:hypothetical protein B566_EDAN012831 [Ephemera danica]|nr:hypothetical protein B566_EDAN012831 [Ephemera danica]